MACEPVVVKFVLLTAYLLVLHTALATASWALLATKPAWLAQRQRHDSISNQSQREDPLAPELRPTEASGCTPWDWGGLLRGQLLKAQCVQSNGGGCDGLWDALVLFLISNPCWDTGSSLTDLGVMVERRDHPSADKVAEWCWLSRVAGWCRLVPSVPAEFNCIWSKCFGCLGDEGIPSWLLMLIPQGLRIYVHMLTANFQ